MSMINENRNKSFDYIQSSAPLAYEDGLTLYNPSTKKACISNNNVWKEFWVSATCEGGSGTLWAWGYNWYGQLGQNDTIFRSSPVQVGNLTDWVVIDSNAERSAVFVIKTDGTLWAWGYNQKGQIGLNDRIDRSSPVQIGNLTDWIKISSGNTYTLAIKTDGTLWAWGYNYDGQLGQNDIINRSSPVQVGSDINWIMVASSYKGGTGAIKTDGTLWAWGYNGRGNLGLNDTVKRSSPVQVGNLTDWALIAGGYKSMRAIKTDGTLWVWGYNGKGQLGLNDGLLRSSPTQVGTDTNWKYVLGIGNGNTIAIKIDGTLWTCGDNYDGQLGQNDRVSRSSPVQVGSDTDWIKIGMNKYWTMYAIKTDGTLWGWGNNDYGQLGQNNRVKRSSPVQVGSDTNYISMFAANYVSLAIKSV